MSTSSPAHAARLVRACDADRPYDSSVTGYTLVVARAPGSRRALAVRKRRPSWQAGRLNFPGGHIEAGETPRECVARELREETGVEAPLEAFRPVAHVCRPGGFEMYVFALEHPDVERAQALTDEPLEFVHVDTLSAMPMNEALENLCWLHGLAFDGFSKFATVVYD